MKNENNKREIVLFLGAGFSVELGFPTMNKFRDEAKKEFDKEKSEWQSINKSNDWINLFNVAGKVYEEFNEWCNIHLLPCNKKDDNLESIFSVAEILSNSIYSVSLNKNRPSLNSKVLLEKIKIWIWKNYQRFPPLDKKKKTKINEDPYKNFFNFLKENNLKQKISIITTNYDLSIEYYAQTFGLPIQYPIKKYNTIGFSNKSHSFLTKSDESIPIIKVHGSINYFEKDGTIYIADKNNRLKNETDSRPEIFRMQNAIKIIKTQGKIPCIIAPSFNKNIMGDWHRDIWQKAFESVRNARHIIFIGYSIPKTDKYIKYFFRIALANRSLFEDIRITIINNDKFVKNKYEDVFSGSKNHTHYFKKFTEICKEEDLGEIFKYDF